MLDSSILIQPLLTAGHPHSRILRSLSSSKFYDLPKCYGNETIWLHPAWPPGLPMMNCLSPHRLHSRSHPSTPMLPLPGMDGFTEFIILLGKPRGEKQTRKERRCLLYTHTHTISCQVLLPLPLWNFFSVSPPFHTHNHCSRSGPHLYLSWAITSAS